MITKHCTPLEAATCIHQLPAKEHIRVTQDGSFIYIQYGAPTVKVNGEDSHTYDGPADGSTYFKIQLT